MDDTLRDIIMFWIAYLVGVIVGALIMGAKEDKK